ncbi:hypothetical protein CKO40_03185 [Halochromatium glycolicum]|uniref:Uncharacterized protein n=1 Tax=Halochromatium glycolicum TaxID=85075 RepID=A0AAJ0U1L1_9GAMM|nr:hypothetical protein [Halochromatium glycolicum]
MRVRRAVRAIVSRFSTMLSTGAVDEPWVARLHWRLLVAAQVLSKLDRLRFIGQAPERKDSIALQVEVSSQGEM